MNKVEKAIKILNKKYGIQNIDYAVVVGSGLLKSIPSLENQINVSYNELGLPASKVQGHSGSFVFGTYKSKKIVLVSRIHYYECGDVSVVRMPLEIVGALQAKTTILLTSCGGTNQSYKVGDVMLIEDHINLTGINPLIAMPKIEFINMVNCYSPILRERVLEISKMHKLGIKCGIFGQMSGPSYETMAEINMLRVLGIDAVSMSTAHDCIIAKSLGMDVVGFSIIVNVFNGDDLTHEEVLDNAEKACSKVKKILENILI